MNKISLTFLLLFGTIILFGQEKGHFNITTEPSSAIVQLTEFPDVEKRTPASFSDYKPMLYSVRITKQNYQTIDTLIHCLPGRVLEYHFELTPNTGICNIISYPSGATVYINHQMVGTTTLTEHPIQCGTNLITLIDENNNKWEKSFIVDDTLPLLVNHNFQNTLQTSKSETFSGNKTYSTPVAYDDFDTFDSSETSVEKETYGGFGAVGFYTMIGSNGAEGTAYRYGGDLFGYLRLWGESNKKSDINGFGFEGVLPLDLDKVSFYAKGGLVSRSFKPLHSSGTENITFVTLGGGLSIKPSPHFQLFAEFEFGMYDEDEIQDTIDLWEQKYNNFSVVNDWVGIRIAF